MDSSLQALCRRIKISPDLVGRSFEHVFAPFYAVWATGLCHSLLVDLLEAMAELLERVDPKVISQGRSSRVLPLVMVRCLRC